ncbi:MAG: hypothetical protein JXR70_19095 [Spirochaetales bacterium]|nr:hypothetical protein [Spirochaetales bacterium]
MKYELDTIPIWTAYEAETECPLCFLMDKINKDLLKFYLGSSVMNPETRAKVNEKGFCPEHFEALYRQGNHQGLALLAHTHWRQFKEDFARRLKKISLPKGIGTKGAFTKELSDLKEWTIQKESSCVFCEKRQEPLNRYIFTIIYLWKKDENFRKAYEDSRGFCAPHFVQVLEMAPDVLSGKTFLDWYGISIQKALDNYNRLDEEILWFTQKFDYRNKDKPWGDSKDALPRVLNKIIGKKID